MTGSEAAAWGGGSPALQGLLSGYVADGRLAGAVAAVIDRTGLRHRLVAGVQDLDSAVPMAWDSVFRIYSMTKPVTSIAAMMLWEEGRFALDDPVAGWLPAFAAPQVLLPGGGTRPAAGPVTVRHLLSHTAGMTLPAFADDPLVPLYLANGLDGIRSTPPLAAAVDRLGRMPLLFDPGTRWRYSMATDAVGRLVELWSGMPFEDFIDRRILAPLGMTETGFRVPAGAAGRLVTTYAVTDGRLGAAIDRGVDSTFLRPPAYICPAGGLVSTAADYLRLMAMLLHGGSLDGVRVLQPETVALMHRNHLPGDMAAMGAGDFNGASWAGIGFGLGFSTVLDPARAGLPPGAVDYGWTGAAGTAFLVNPEAGIAALLLAQYMPSRAYPLRAEFRQAVYRDLARGDG